MIIRRFYPRIKFEDKLFGIMRHPESGGVVIGRTNSGNYKAGDRSDVTKMLNRIRCSAAIFDLRRRRKEEFYSAAPDVRDHAR
jgi:hypothetical protein